MIKHYLKIAVRSMMRQKMFSFIKIGGFAIGIAACLLIGLLVRHELSYDRQYPQSENIYRLLAQYTGDGSFEKSTSFPAPTAKALRADLPEIRETGRLMPNQLFNGAGANQFRRADQAEDTYEEGFCFADQQVLDILELPMVYGNRATALKDPFSIVLSKTKAEKYFPGENPVGKSVYLNNNTNRPIKIGGVMEDLPATSHLQYDFFISLAGVSFWKGEQETWDASNYEIYMLMQPGTDIPAFEKKMTETVLRNYIIPNMQKNGDVKIEKLVEHAHLFMQPVGDIHLRSNDIREGFPRGDIRYVWLFAAIAGFILLIACVNFLNLSTARSANRAKEVGIRKVIGSQRFSLVKQFLAESMLYSVVSFVIGLGIVYLALPLFSKIADRDLAIPWTSWWWLPSLLISAVLVGFIAGIYPAFYLSAFKPISVLKGKLSRGTRNSGLRSTLVVFQFVTSIVLLIGTLVVYRQMRFILDSKTGFDKEQVLLVQGTNTLNSNIGTFKNELLSVPGVSAVSVSDFLPVANTKRNGNTFWKEGKTREEAGTGGQIWTVDNDYVSTMGMKIIAGRNFSKDMPTDSQALIINQTMMSKLGYKEPPIGQKITNGMADYTIIGVVADFNFESMKYLVDPLCLSLGKSIDVVSVKIKAGETKSALAAVEKIWKDFMPHQAMRYVFLDESYAAMYRDVERTGYMFTGFAILAIIVACLGLFALAAFMAEQRSKEISVRKVLGASVPSLFKLLTFDFLKLIIISLAIALPLGGWLMSKWLEDFSYRTGLSWDVFVLASMAIAFIALFTVCYQAVRAALANPIKSLRAE